MHYELYIDLFFLINFLMDYFLLLMVGKMLKCRIRRLRIIAGAMVGAFLTCIFVVFLRGKIWRLVLFHGVMNMCLLKTGLGIKEKAYSDKSMDIAVCQCIFAGRNTECISAIRSWRCSVFNTCICRISSLSWNMGFAGLFS